MAKRDRVTPSAADTPVETQRFWFSAYLASTFREPFSPPTEAALALPERERDLRRRASILRLILFSMAGAIILVVLPAALLTQAPLTFTETMIGELVLCVLCLILNALTRSYAAGICFILGTMALGFSYAFNNPDELTVVGLLLLAALALTIFIAGLVLPVWMMWAALVILISVTTYGVLVTPLSSDITAALTANLSFRVTTVTVLVVIQMLSAIFATIYLAAANAGLRGALRAIEREHELTALKDQFLIDANHELRTPVMAWYANIEVLSMLNTRATAEQRTRLVKRAMDAGDLVRRLLTTMLDASIIESTVPRMSPKAIQVAPLARSLLETFDPRQVGEPGLEDIAYASREVTMNIPADLWVYADEDRLRQVLTNLVTNALKYSDSSTSIAITAALDSMAGARSRMAATPQARAKIADDAHGANGARRANGENSAASRVAISGQFARISVRDYGLGVPARDAHKLFQRFVRLERDIAGPVRGTGVGLYLCRLLVEAMGGRIWVESSGRPGEGSTFSFTLPVATGVVEASPAVGADHTLNGHGPAPTL